MFDDSKRLDALEGRMKAVEKSAADAAALTAEVNKLKTWAEAQFKEEERREDNRGKIQQQTIEEVEKVALRVEGDLKKALQRIQVLEQQVKNLKK